MTTSHRKPLHICATPYCRRPKRKKGGKGPGLCNRCSMRLWRAQNPVKAKLGWLRDRAIKKGVPFNLTYRWLARFLCREGYDSSRHHIDRIKPEKGYVKRNLQILVGGENIAKGNRERHGYAWREKVEVPF